MRKTTWWLVASLVVLVSAASCSKLGIFRERVGKNGESCTKTDECDSGLICVGQVCVPENASAAAGSLPPKAPGQAQTLPPPAQIPAPALEPPAPAPVPVTAPALSPAPPAMPTQALSPPPAAPVQAVAPVPPEPPAAAMAPPPPAMPAPAPIDVPPAAAAPVEPAPAPVAAVPPPCILGARMVNGIGYESKVADIAGAIPPGWKLLRRGVTAGWESMCTASLLAVDERGIEQIRFDVDTERVVNIDILGKACRTAEGIGLGSRLSEVVGLGADLRCNCSFQDMELLGVCPGEWCQSRMTMALTCSGSRPCESNTLDDEQGGYVNCPANWKSADCTVYRIDIHEVAG